MTELNTPVVLLSGEEYKELLVTEIKLTGRIEELLVKSQERERKFVGDIIELSIIVHEFLESKKILPAQFKDFAASKGIELTYEPIPGSNGKYVLFTKQREQK